MPGTGIDGFDEVFGGLPGGCLAVVRGAPGTGKTAFATSFIYNGAVRYGEPGVYASLMENAEKFNEYVRGFGHDFKPLEERGLFKYIALPTLLREGLSASINTILESVESMGAKRLVIDSYTAINQMFESRAEARVFLHTLLSKILSKLNCTTILIKEEEDPGRPRYGFEEFVADAVIQLRMGRLDDKLIRELTIIKLRGSEVKLPDACFSLHGGFRVLGPLEMRRGGAVYRPPPDPPAAYTTGLPDLDMEIGGYPQGSTILLELDPKLTLEQTCHTILYPAIASFVLKGRYVGIAPCDGLAPSLIRDGLTGYGVGEQAFLEQVKLFYEAGSVAEKLPNVVEVEYDPAEAAMKKIHDYAREMAEKLREQSLWIIGIDRLIRLYGEKGLNLLKMNQDYIRTRKSLWIWVLKPVTPEIERRLAATADIHLKMMRRHGCILLYGIKPRTPLYAIQTDTTKPTPKIIPVT